MNLRALPIIPTILVVAAAAVMVALGVWQLQRAEWKAALIAQYEDAQARGARVDWPRSGAAQDAALYGSTAVLCERVLEVEAIAGRSIAGEAGWAQIAHCALDGGGEGEIALGWSRRPELSGWEGGRVTGLVAPAADGVRLIADPPQAGLQQLARPDPADMPNNHLAYAGQWFFFALTALVIYALALRKRLRGG